MAWDWGPDGALYILDWGSGFGGNNADSGVYRIDYLAASRAPVVQATRRRHQRPDAADRAVQLRGDVRPQRRDDLTYAWDLDGDGDTDSTDGEPHRSPTAPPGPTRRCSR